MKHILTILLLFVFTSIFAESYTVISTLNIRSAESKTSKIIGKLAKNTIIEGTDVGNGWIKLDNGKGFVNSAFAIKIKTSSDEKSFGKIYKTAYFYSCWIIAIICGTLYSGYNTKKDKRYKKGYNPKSDKIEFTKGFIIGALISLPISLITSLIYTVYKIYF